MGFLGTAAVRKLTFSMLPFKLVYSDAYYLPIGEHVFPGEKYRRIRDRLLADGIADSKDFLEPEPASDDDVLLVHNSGVCIQVEDWQAEPARGNGDGNSLLGRPGGGFLDSSGRLDISRAASADR